jgi:hypothetical protein
MNWCSVMQELLLYPEPIIIMPEATLNSMIFIFGRNISDTTNYISY